MQVYALMAKLLVTYLGATVALMAAHSTAIAVPIRFDFSGTITNTSFTNGDPFGGQVVVGSKFRGRYSFDSTVTPSPGDACALVNSQCTWYFDVPANRFEAQIGLLAVAVPSGVEGFLIQITNGLGNSTNDYDSYAVSSRGPFAFMGVEAVLQLILGDSSGVAITDPKNLPLLPPDLMAFQRFTELGFQLKDSNGLGWGRIEGRLELLTVPEPLSSTLVGIGLLALRLSRRRFLPDRISTKQALKYAELRSD